MEPQSPDTLFPTLTVEQMDCLRPYATEITAQPGDVLFEEGTPADTFFVLLEGESKVTRQVSGGEVVLAVHHPGQFTGEISMLAGGNSIATGRAVQASRILKIPVAGLRKVLVSCPWMSEIVLTAMAQRRPEADLLVQ